MTKKDSAKFDKNKKRQQLLPFFYKNKKPYLKSESFA